MRRLEQRVRSNYWKNRAFALREIKLAVDLRKRAEADLAKASNDNEARDRMAGQVHAALEYEAAMRNYLEGVEERHEEFRKEQIKREQEKSREQQSESDSAQPVNTDVTG